ncbi:MAG: DsrE family protein [Pseudomonadota bacterium]
MNFSLFVDKAPDKNIEQSTALLTARAIIASKHNLYRVFFYSEGVLHHSEPTKVAAYPWQALASNSSIDLCFCSASVKKHQVSMADHANVSLGGLVQLLDAQVNSDRIVSLS